MDFFILKSCSRAIFEIMEKNPHKVFKGEKIPMMRVGVAFFLLRSGSGAKTNVCI